MGRFWQSTRDSEGWAYYAESPLDFWPSDSIAMQINSRQLAHFDSIAFDGFVDRLVVFMRVECGAPDAFYPSLLAADDTELRRQVSSHLRRARGFGIKGESALAAFVSLAFSYSAEFDLIPALREMLTDGTASPDQQIFKVFGLLVDAERRRHLGLDARVSNPAQGAVQ